MPKPLHDRLDSYCNSVMKGKRRLKSAVIRNAIVEFLDKQKENYEAVIQIKWINIYALRPLFHFKPLLANRPAQTGAERAYF